MMKKAILFVILVFTNILDCYSQKFGSNYNDSLWQMQMVTQLSQLIGDDYNITYQYYNKIADSLLNEVAKNVKEKGFNLYNGETGKQTANYDNYSEYIEKKMHLNEKNTSPILLLPDIDTNALKVWKINFNLKLNAIREAIWLKQNHNNFNIVDSLSSIATFEITKLPIEKQIECWIDFYNVIVQQKDSIPNSWDFPAYFYFQRFAKRNVLNTSMENLWSINYSLNKIEEQIKCGLQIFMFFQRYEMKRQMDQTLVRLFNLKGLREYPELFYELIYKTSDYLVVADNKELSLSICADSLLVDRFLAKKYFSDNILKKIDADSNYNFKMSDFPTLIFYNPDVNKYIPKTTYAHSPLYMKFNIWNMFKNMEEESEVLSQLAFWQMFNYFDTKFPFNGHIFWEHLLFSKAYTMKTIDEQLWVLERYCLLQIEKGNLKKSSQAFENYFSRNYTINSLDYLLGNINRLIQNNAIEDNTELEKLFDIIYKVYMDNSIYKKNENRLFSNYCNTKYEYFFRSSKNYANKLDSVYKYGYLGYKFNDNLQFIDQFTDVTDEFWNRKNNDNLYKSIDNFKLLFISKEKEYKSKLLVLKSDFEKSKIKYNDSLRAKGSELIMANANLDIATKKYKSDSFKNANMLYEQNEKLIALKEQAKREKENSELSRILGKRRFWGTVFFSVIMISLIARYYTKSAKQKNKELATARITAITASLNPHFIKSIINKLPSTFNILGETNFKKYCNKLYELINLTYNYADDRITSVRAEGDVISKLIRFYNETPLHNTNKITFDLIVSDNINLILILPKMLLFNLAENTVTKAFDVNYSGIKNLQIIAKEKNRNIEIDIKDNGMGMKNEEAEKLDGALAKNQKIIDSFNITQNSYLVEQKFVPETKGTHFKLIFSKK